MAAEFARGGSDEAAAALVEVNRGFRLPLAAISAFVLDGIEHPRLWRIGPEERAALEFVRARHLMTQGRSGDALIKSALRRDLLHGLVTTAIKAWPKPVAATPPLILRHTR